MNAKAGSWAIERRCQAADRERGHSAVSDCPRPLLVETGISGRTGGLSSPVCQSLKQVAEARVVSQRADAGIRLHPVSIEVVLCRTMVACQNAILHLNCDHPRVNRCRCRMHMSRGVPTHGEAGTAKSSALRHRIWLRLSAREVVRLRRTASPWQTIHLILFSLCPSRAKLISYRSVLEAIAAQQISCLLACLLACLRDSWPSALKGGRPLRINVI
jgi:hypothetical protein